VVDARRDPHLVKLDGTQGVRAENLTIDCNSVAGSTGIFATDINEQAGAINDRNCELRRVRGERGYSSHHRFSAAHAAKRLH